MKPFVFAASLITLAACGAPCEDSPGCLIDQELPAGLLSVQAPSADDVWIVGATPEPSDGSGPVVLHFDGAKWERLGASAWDGAELWWAWVSDDEAVFVGNQGLILELDRASGELSQVEGPDLETTFFGVWGASSDALWAVGQSAGGEGPPAIWRRTGGEWAAWVPPVYGPGQDGQVYFKVHGQAADDLWIVGSQGTALRWDGDALTSSPITGDHSTAPLLTVDTSGPRPIAVGGVGNGLVVEFDGESWADVSPDFMPGFNGVCTGAGAAWAVGQYGARALRAEDGSWASNPDPTEGLPLTPEDWHGCAIDPDGGLWTVGGRIASRPLVEGVVGYQGPAELPEDGVM